MFKKIYLLVFILLFITFSFPGCSKSTEKLSGNTSNSELEISYTGSLKDYIKSLGKPGIIDFGSTGCIPCKMMEPVLQELSKNYSDKFETIFINVAKDSKGTQEFGINVVPTQIFFDANGKELYRHIGFFSKEEILNTFESYGISVK
jgi:thiol-disulfide isomerase/thioredoxin